MSGGQSDRFIRKLYRTLVGLTSPFRCPFSFSSLSFSFCLIFLSFSLASRFVASSNCLARSFNSSWRDNNCWPMGIESDDVIDQSAKRGYIASSNQKRQTQAGCKRCRWAMERNEGFFLLDGRQNKIKKYFELSLTLFREFCNVG